MHCEFPLDEGFYYVGGSDRRLALFENIYPLENGASFNSYLFLDEKTVLLDTVDEAVSKVFFENLEFLLAGRPLDYLIVDHMEPDHAANIGELLLRYPNVTIVTSQMASMFLKNFFPNLKCNVQVVKEGDTLNTGKRTFRFIAASMVHWPEVIMTYEETTKTLFSADAFGTFGALSGNVVECGCKFVKKHLAEARRYYANIVGKYGVQVTGVLKKAATLDIARIAPLHGPVYEGHLDEIIDVYAKWAAYEPEDEDGVLIVYGSIYGGTANAAEVLAKELALRGVKNIALYDVSKTDSSVLVGEAFRVGTILLLSSTYNLGVFQKMEDYLHDLASHLIKNRTFGIVENGSWSPAAAKCMHAILDPLPGNKFLEKTFTIRSVAKEEQLADLKELADQALATLTLE